MYQPQQTYYSSTVIYKEEKQDNFSNFLDEIEFQEDQIGLQQDSLAELNSTLSLAAEQALISQGAASRNNFFDEFSLTEIHERLEDLSWEDQETSQDDDDEELMEINHEMRELKLDLELMAIEEIYKFHREQDAILSPFVADKIYNAIQKQFTSFTSKLSFAVSSTEKNIFRPAEGRTQHKNFYPVTSLVMRSSIS